jgi:hypothetical protein
MTIKLRTIRWEEHEVHMGALYMCEQNFERKPPRERDYAAEQDIDKG